MAHGRRYRIEKQLGAFIRQYGRRGRAPHDPNDRGYDRKIEAQLKRLKPEELDVLLRDEEPSSLRTPSLRIEFRAPVAGWIRARVTTASGHAEVFVSHTPNDFLRELVTALLNTSEAAGAYEALANEEPRQVAFAFRRVTERVEFSAYDSSSGDLLAGFNGSVSQVVLPFWRSLRHLQAEFPQPEWRWQFPASEMKQLGAIVESIKTAG